MDIYTAVDGVLDNFIIKHSNHVDKYNNTINGIDFMKSHKEETLKVAKEKYYSKFNWLKSFLETLLCDNLEELGETKTFNKIGASYRTDITLEFIRKYPDNAPHRCESGYTTCGRYTYHTRWNWKALMYSSSLEEIKKFITYVPAELDSISMRSDISLDFIDEYIELYETMKKSTSFKNMRCFIHGIMTRNSFNWGYLSRYSSFTELERYAKEGLMVHEDASYREDITTSFVDEFPGEWNFKLIAMFTKLENLHDFCEKDLVDYNVITLRSDLTYKFVKDHPSKHYNISTISMNCPMEELYKFAEHDYITFNGLIKRKVLDKEFVIKYLDKHIFLDDSKYNLQYTTVNIPSGWSKDDYNRLKTLNEATISLKSLSAEDRDIVISNCSG